MTFNKIKLFSTLSLSITTFLALVMVPSVFAQDQDADNLWVKLCNIDEETNRELCLITQELRTATGQFLASVALREISDEERKTLILAVPPGMLIQPGLTISVDGEQEREAKYGICFPNACYSELVIDEEVVSGFKRGGELTITTFNQQAKKVPFTLSLLGFTKTYEGEPMDPEELQKRQQQLQQNLKDRADAARQKLIEEQRKASESSFSGGQGPTHEAAEKLENSTDQ